MSDVLKNRFDLKTLVSLVLFITALVANNIKGKYELESSIKQVRFDHDLEMNRLESGIKNRDDLQDRDIQDVKNQQRVDEEVIKGQNFLIDNIQKNLISHNYCLF